MPLKAWEEAEEDKQEVTASLANETSVEAAVVAVLEPDGVFAFKRRAPKAFPQWKNMFLLRSSLPLARAGADSG